jgi:hypothetical protein
MILFQSIVEIGVGPVRDRLAELGADRLGVSVVAIAGDPIGNTPGRGLRRGERTPWPAGRSRRSLSMTSIKAPFRSMAR